jgi:hypothetical protein
MRLTCTWSSTSSFNQQIEPRTVERSGEDELRHGVTELRRDFYAIW